MYTLILVGVMLAISGCGKTLDQIKQVGHDVIDVAGKVYEDSVDNAKTAKDAVMPAEEKK